MSERDEGHGVEHVGMKEGMAMSKAGCDGGHGEEQIEHDSDGVNNKKYEHVMNPNQTSEQAFKGTPWKTVSSDIMLTKVSSVH